MIVFEQEIPPGGRSGAQKTPGGSVLYILEGKGFTLLDGERHDWQAEDLVNIPIRAEGVVVQHVNADPRRPVRFISADLNLVDILGVDRGAELEQIEAAPDGDGEKSKRSSEDSRCRTGRRPLYIRAFARRIGPFDAGDGEVWAAPSGSSSAPLSRDTPGAHRHLSTTSGKSIWSAAPKGFSLSRRRRRRQDGDGQALDLRVVPPVRR